MANSMDIIWYRDGRLSRKFNLIKRDRERERERERIQKVAFLRTHKIVKNMHEQYYDNL